MIRRLAPILLASLTLAVSAQAVTLPGIRYEVVAAGLKTGAHPTRADSVTMRYVGRLQTSSAVWGGEVFSTSPQDGRQAATFAVNQVIPGMSAALQLMRVGDHWKISMPPYLAYGPGRAFTPPSAQPVAGRATPVMQRRGIPPGATLLFDVELVSILPPKAP